MVAPRGITQLIVFSGIILSGCAPESDPPAAADQVLMNGYVYTVDAERSVAEAVAIHDGRIAFVGSNTDVATLIDEGTEVIDLNGQMLLPGFHDSHTHILIGDAAHEECNLLNIESVPEVEAKLRECTELPGVGEDKWIIGSGWAAWLYPKSEPDKAILDELFPDRPVVLGSSFGHTMWKLRSIIFDHHSTTTRK